MRAFIILGFVIAAANAASLGYNYGPGISPIEGSSSNRIIQTSGGSGLIGGGSGLIGGGGGSSGLLGISSGSNYNTGGRVVGTGGLIGGNYGGGVVGTGGLVGGNYGGGVVGTGGLVGGNYGGGLVGTSGLIGGNSNYGGRVVGSGGLVGSQSGLVSTSIGHGTSIGLNPSALDSIPQTVEYSKQFFFYSAPEEHQDEGLVTQQLSNVLKKNLQVVFIKAPENNAATNAALQLAKQAIEQRTAIYVLSKENDGAQLVGQLQQIQENVPTTPEVRFIKYRTPEDIAYARDVIQSQYDNFGGSSQVIDGGIAPVLNYASQGSTGGSILGTNLGVGSSQVVGGGRYGINKITGGGSTFLTGASNTNANYLPPSPLKK